MNQQHYRIKLTTLGLTDKSSAISDWWQLIPQEEPLEFSTPFEALQELVGNFLSNETGNLVEAECFRFEGTERKERQWAITID